jgi:hypothetical protein
MEHPWEEQDLKIDEVISLFDCFVADIDDILHRAWYASSVEVDL